MNQRRKLMKNIMSLGSLKNLSKTSLRKNVQLKNQKKEIYVKSFED
jgi:hypothetical protein